MNLITAAVIILLLVMNVVQFIVNHKRKKELKMIEKLAEEITHIKNSF